MKSITINYHFKELKWRTLYGILSSCITILICYEYKTELLCLLSSPLFDIGVSKFVYTNLSEAFLAYLKLSIFIGMYWTLPLWLLFFYRFLKPGLYYKEKTTIKKSILIGLLFTAIGQLIFWLYIGPVIFKFFVEFEGTNQIYSLDLLIKLRGLTDLLTNLIFSVTIFFGLPGFLIYNKTYQNIINSSIKYRPFVWFIILTTSAIITPPDIISQILFGLPLFIILECSYLLMCIAKEYHKIQETTWKSPD